MIEVPADLPGHDLVSAGLADLAAGRETEPALLVAMAAPRLRALGFDVPAGGGERPSHRLYELLSETDRGATAMLGGWRESTIDVDVSPSAARSARPPGSESRALGPRLERPARLTGPLARE